MSPSVRRWGCCDSGAADRVCSSSRVIPARSSDSGIDFRRETGLSGRQGIAGQRVAVMGLRDRVSRLNGCDIVRRRVHGFLPLTDDRASAALRMRQLSSNCAAPTGLT